MNPIKTIVDILNLEFNQELYAVKPDGDEIKTYVMNALSKYASGTVEFVVAGTNTGIRIRIDEKTGDEILENRGCPQDTLFFTNILHANRAIITKRICNGNTRLANLLNQAQKLRDRLAIMGKETKYIDEQIELGEEEYTS